MRPLGPCVAVAAIFSLAACASGQTYEIDETAIEHLDSSPLAEFYTAVYGQVQIAQEDDEAAARARMIREAELTAACMGDQGFDYTPWFPGIETARLAVDEPAPLDPLEEASQWGYGVFAGSESLAGDVAASPDPNQARVEQMSEGEKDAYWKALVGDGMTGIAGKLEKADGCMPWSAQEVNEVLPQEAIAESVLQDPRFSELDNAIQLLPETFAGSDGLATANSAWSDCMASAGHTYTSPEAAEAYFINLGEEIESRVSVKAQEAATAEVVTAIADQQCQMDTGYDASLEQLMWNIEKQLLDRYSDDITDLKAAIAQRG